MPSPMFTPIGRCTSTVSYPKLLTDTVGEELPSLVEHLVDQLEALRSFISEEFASQNAKLDALQLKIDVGNCGRSTKLQNRNSDATNIARCLRVSGEVFGGLPKGLENNIIRPACDQSISERKYAHSAARKIYSFLEDSGASATAQKYHNILPLIIFVTIIWSSLVSVSDCCSREFTCVDVVIELCFAIELTLRFVTCPSRIAFIKQFFNLVDILTVLPVFLRLFVMLSDSLLIPLSLETIVAALRGAVPLLRILKMVRHFTTIHLLTEAFHISLEALPVLLYILTVIFMSGTCFVYVAEIAWYAEGGSISTAAWLIFISMTTVGYGDVVPQTFPGRLAVAFVVLLTMLYMSIPLGIIGDAFGQVWGRRQIVLLLRKFRARLVNFGFTPADIREAFDEHTLDDNTQMTLVEFYLMVENMGLGFSYVEVSEIFKAFDADGSGTCTVQEILLILFSNCMSNELTHYKVSKLGSTPSVSADKSAASK